MPDNEPIQQLRIDVARLEGKVDAFTQLQKLDRDDVKKIESRIWALVVGVGASFGTAILSLIMAFVAKNNHGIAEAARSLVSYLF